MTSIIPLYFLFSGKVLIFISLLTFLKFYYLVCWDGKVDNFFLLSLVLVVWIRGSAIIIIIITIIFYSLRIFHISVYWSLSDNKSSQVCWALLTILADPNNALVWMDSTHPLISKHPVPLLILQ